MSKLYSDLSPVEEENIFSYGFSLGLFLMMDVMGDRKPFATNKSMNGRRGLPHGNPFFVGKITYENSKH